MTATMSELERFKRKHKNQRTRWTAPKDFPSKAALKAYANPAVDHSKDRFEFGTIDTDALALLCAAKLNWSLEEFERNFDPVLAKQAEGARGGKQAKLESYFMSYGDKKFAGGVKSKRLQGVLERRTGGVAGAEVERGGRKNSGKGKAGGSAEEGGTKKRKGKEAKEEEEEEEEEEKDDEEEKDEEGEEEGEKEPSKKKKTKKGSPPQKKRAEKGKGKETEKPKLKSAKKKKQKKKRRRKEEAFDSSGSSSSSSGSEGEEWTAASGNDV